MTEPVFDAIVQAAVGASGAEQGWLLGLSDGVLRVVSAAGERPGDVLGVTVPADQGTAGFAVASGQPLAAVPRAGDDRFTVGVAASLGLRASSVLCVPCGTNDGVLGALEVVNKVDGAFTIDDVELVTLLGGIAGAALADEGSSANNVPPPEELGGELRELASTDPSRYAAVAVAISALLAQ
jgi:GAF domain-containing protein